MVANAPTTPAHIHAAAGEPATKLANEPALLAALLTNHFDPLKTAFETGTPLFHLLAWAARPDIQQAIETFRHLQFANVNSRLLANTADERIAAVKRLHELGKTTTDPIEQRRTANLILRYSTPISFSRLLNPAGPRRALPTPTALPAPSPALSLNFPLAPAPPATDATNAERPAPPSTTAPTPTSPPPVLRPPVPSKLRTPPLRCATPDQLLRSLERSLMRQRPHTTAGRLAAIHNLYRHLAQPSTINGAPVPDDPDAFAFSLDKTTQDDLITQILQVRRHTRHSETLSHHETLYIARHRQRMVQAEVTLTRDSETAPWRITTLTTRVSSA